MQAKSFYTTLILLIGIVTILVGEKLDGFEWVSRLFGPLTVFWLMCYEYCAYVTNETLLETEPYHREVSPFVTRPWLAYGLGATLAPFWALAIGLGAVNDH